jgi:hypothetical protein
MRRLTGSVVFALLAAVAGAGCDSQTTTTTTPTTPTTPITESFTGSITVTGAVAYPFSVSAAGYVQASLKTLTPETAAQIGLALGTWSGTTCNVVLANDTAAAGLTVTGYANSASILCVRIYDVGQLTQTNTFEITVSHP